MAKQTKTTKRRTQVKDLPKREKRLSKEESKKVKGGADAPTTVPIDPNEKDHLLDAFEKTSTKVIGLARAE